ncbi:hypothetical protein COLO4_18733 [Corchorus olitorius]|uniref:Uncharacterized protein n=1 Tax=Corchorus olitorius TaxID=93759 RepID=A0A1R3J809_9ROSI|nr:hypothetical protein COLO4_18733 [Corchorus olitorius]
MNRRREKRAEIQLPLQAVQKTEYQSEMVNSPLLLFELSRELCVCRETKSKSDTERGVERYSALCSRNFKIIQKLFGGNILASHCLDLDFVLHIRIFVIFIL